jgi:hypothetical protein
LPAESAIHPVFHVSQLKQAPGKHLVSSALPSDAALFQIPERILQRRMTQGDRPSLQGLINWSGMPEALATWEDLEAPRLLFPLAPTWVQVTSEEGGMLAAHLVQASKQLRAQAPSVYLRPTCVLVDQSGVKACISSEWEGRRGMM